MRIIIHSDLNNFFASVECLKKPWLKDVPMAVAGDSELRHGVILAKNIHAAAYGVKTAEPIWAAKRKCPDLITVPPNHDDYIIISRKVRKIYEEYSNNIEAFGIDECWIDISDIAKDFETGRQIADEIRTKIYELIGITASCGVSFNKVFAKLGSDIKKPDATTVISDKNFKEIVWPLDADKLLFVGRSTNKSLSQMNIHTIGDIANTDERSLELIFGKHGKSLWQNANGLDHSPVKDVDLPSIVKSVSHSITLPRDIINDDDVRVVLLSLSEKVSGRLRRLDMVCSTVQIYVRDFELYSYERQQKLSLPNRTASAIFESAFDLFKANHTSGKPIRSLGVRATDLSYDSVQQLSISKIHDDLEKYERIEAVTDGIREKFGITALKRGVMLTSNVLDGVESKNE